MGKILTSKKSYLETGLAQHLRHTELVILIGDVLTFGVLTASWNTQQNRSDERL